MTRKTNKNTIKKLVNDDEWIKEHFEELVDKYPGQYLVVINREPFIGYDAVKLFEQARSKYPGVTPTCMPIPRPEDFVSILPSAIPPKPLYLPLPSNRYTPASIAIRIFVCEHCGFLF